LAAIYTKLYQALPSSTKARSKEPAIAVHRRMFSEIANEPKA
jgi:hypothetical protein